MDEFYETQGGTTDIPENGRRLWRFTPIAGDDDKRWLGGPIWSEVTVRALTSGQAVQLAAEWETEMLRDETGAHSSGGRLMDHRSALADPGLYRVEEIEDSEPDGGPGVVSHGDPRPPVSDPNLWIEAADRANEDELIGVRAYQIWLAEGEPEGKEEEHWRRAREELAAGRR